MKRRAALIVAALAFASTACDTPRRSMPECDSGPRLAILAQSVAAAAYVPCITELPTGWEFDAFDVDHRGAAITLRSDRADREVDVELTSTCDTAQATPIAPSEAGTRTYQLIESIDPRYAGSFIDVFPGGCVVTSYDFRFGAHVALITEVQQIVGLYSRQQLRQELDAELDIELDPG